MPYVPSGKNRSCESSVNHGVEMWTSSYIFLFAGSELTDRRQMQKQHTVCGFKVLHHPRPTKRYEMQQLWVQWSSFHPAVWSIRYLFPQILEAQQCCSGCGLPNVFHRNQCPAHTASMKVCMQILTISQLYAASLLCRTGPCM